jgi:hypothetical protein
MRVVDGSDQPVTAVTAIMQGVRHIVDIENVSTLTRSARVQALLPQGKKRIAFLIENTQTDRWDQHVEDIPSRATRQLECNIVRTVEPSGHPNEPIQCHKVYERRGRQTWVEKSADKLPFEITVRVA